MGGYFLPSSMVNAQLLAISNCFHGIRPMLAIYQARYMKYLINRGLIKDEGRKVWAFLGDGEMDEPESLEQ